MSTNRVRIKRAVRSRVTDEARAIYAEALALQHIRDEHIRGMCPLRSASIARIACDIWTWVANLGACSASNSGRCRRSNADSEDPPKWMRNNPLQHGYWVKAWALRCELGSGRGMTAYRCRPAKRRFAPTSAWVRSLSSFSYSAKMAAANKSMAWRSKSCAEGKC